MKIKTYKTSITNTLTGETSVRYCETSKGFAYAISQAIEFVEQDTLTNWLPSKWIIESEEVMS